MKFEGLAAGALTAYLLVTAALSGLDLAGEARSIELGTVTDSLDERVERGVHDAELYRILRDATPPSAQVFFLGDATDAGTHLAFIQTEPLVFPRRFFRVEKIPAGWQPADLSAEGPICAVGYGAMRGVDLGEWFTQVAEGANFRVWLLTKEAR